MKLNFLEPGTGCTEMKFTQGVEKVSSCETGQSVEQVFMQPNDVLFLSQQ